MKKFLFLISCLVLFGLTGCKHEVEKQSYSVTITNNCSDDIIVDVGYIPLTKNNSFDWDNAGYSEFKHNYVLAQNESVLVSGKLADNEWFCIGATIKSSQLRYWPVEPRSKYVYFRENEQNPGNVLLSKYRTDISVLTKKTYSFTIQNALTQDIQICVGDVPKVAGKYLWDYANGYTSSYEKEIKTGQSLDITGGLYDGSSFVVDVYKKAADGKTYEYYSGWAVDPGYETFYIYNGDKEDSSVVSGIALAKKEGKITNTGASDIYPLTITNKFAEPVIVFAGDVPYTITNNQNVYNKNAANPESFLGKVILEPGEDIKIYGKLTDGKAFYVTVWPLYGSGGSWWAFTPPNNQADVVAHDEYKVAINWSNTSSGSSSSSQILLSTRNPMVYVSK